jgi:NAD(P)-dependent dehydrogenase (short-subunit alcohol dehydrogenase family)
MSTATEPTTATTGDRFRDKVVVVTGSGQSIGAAIARLFASEGASVVVNSRRERNDDDTTTAADTEREITEAGGTAVAVFADVGTEEGCAQVVGAAVENFGGVHILVNNAGGGPQTGGTALSKALGEFTLEEWERALRTNVTSQFLCSQLAAPSMQEAGWGRIVNLGSTAGLLGISKMAAYSAAKGATIGLTLALAKELAEFGVTVNCVLPSAATVRSERNRANRAKVSGLVVLPDPLRTPEGVAPLVAYLCTDEAADTNGQILFGGSGRVTLYRWPPPSTTVVKPDHWTIDELDTAFSRHFGRPLQPPPLDV